MAGQVPLIEILGYWLGIFLTLSILSFLYKDNPFYKFAEHLFIGVSIGYVITQQYYDTLEPKLFSRLRGEDWFVALIPLALFMMLFAKTLSDRWSWMGRYPLAFVVAFYAALEVNALAQSDLGKQMDAAMQDLDPELINLNDASPAALAGLPGIGPDTAAVIAEVREQQPIQNVPQLADLPQLSPDQQLAIKSNLVALTGAAGTTPFARDWFQIFSRVLLLLGLLASLIYFYFSIEQKGPVGKISRFGVWILMIGFGASFGYTVQGRLALAIGRAVDVLGKDKDPALAERIQGPLVAIISIVIIIVGIVIWELRVRKRSREAPAES